VFDEYCSLFFMIYRNFIPLCTAALLAKFLVATVNHDTTTIIVLLE